MNHLSIALLTLFGLPVDMYEIHDADDLIYYINQRMPLLPLDMLEKSARGFMEKYNSHYMDRLKAARQRQAAQVASSDSSRSDSSSPPLVTQSSDTSSDSIQA